jgi:hypothetical protein
MVGKVALRGGREAGDEGSGGGGGRERHRWFQIFMLDK